MFNSERVEWESLYSEILSSEILESKTLDSENFNSESLASGSLDSESHGVYIFYVNYIFPPLLSGHHVFPPIHQLKWKENIRKKRTYMYTLYFI